MPQSQSTSPKTNKIKPVFENIRIDGKPFVRVEISQRGKSVSRETAPNYFKM